MRLATTYPANTSGTSATLRWRRFLGVVFLVAAALGGNACGGGGGGDPTLPEPITISSITVNPTTVTLSVGGTRTVTATLTPSNATGTISWSVTNPIVATVSGSGSTATVTGVGVGSTVVTASVGGKSFNVGVTVSVVGNPTMTLTPATVALVPAQTQSMTATPRDASGAVISNPSITWTSSSAAVATVTVAGLVTAVSVGTTTISATLGTASASAIVTVSEGGFIGTSGGTINALAGQVQLTIPAGAVSTPTAFTVRVASVPPADSRLLANTAVVIEPATTFSTVATLRLKYPATLDAGVVETQLRLARLNGTTWQDSPVRTVDRTGRLASALITTSGTWAVFAPPPSLRGFAQLRGLEIGAAIADDALRTDTAYRRVLAAEFNSVTPENNMKFGPIHPSATTYSFAGADSLLSFATANGMKIHGHVLLWHSQQPAWLTAGTPTRASLLAALKEHIETVVGRYAGRLASWDVANEMIADNQTGIRQSFWTAIVGPDVIDSAFTWARRRDPTAKLYLNDYSVEAIGAKSDSLFALANRLKNAGVPIEGVGLQAHFLLPGPSLAQISANIARFAAAGFDVRFTELDVRLADGTDGLAAQATAYSNVVTACRAQPRCKAVTAWGITDKYSWIPGAFPGFGRGLPFDANFNPKPAYNSLRDALSSP